MICAGLAALGIGGGLLARSRRKPNPLRGSIVYGGGGWFAGCFVTFPRISRISDGGPPYCPPLAPGPDPQGVSAEPLEHHQ